MSARHIILAIFCRYAKHYQSWWKFDKVLTRTVLHSCFFETRCKTAAVESSIDRLEGCSCWFIWQMMSAVDHHSKALQVFVA